MTFDVFRRDKRNFGAKKLLGAKKLMVIIPGVTGDSEEYYIKDCAIQAWEAGFNVFVVNPLAPSATNCDGLAIIDFTRDEAITEIIEIAKKTFPNGENEELYLLAFSLGSNYMLKHLGSHQDCAKICNVKAAISVSSAFDILSCGMKLKYTTLGIYDWYILK